MPEGSPTSAEIDAFHRDGAVLLRGLLSPTWMQVIEDAIEAVLAAPGPRSKFAVPESRSFFQDSDNRRRVAAIDEIVWRSPVADAARRLLRSRKINFLQDHILVKEPGTERHTIWHQDQPYSPVDGRDFITFWIAADPVPVERSLRLVRGSHLAGRWYRPRHFSNGKERDGDDPTWAPIPDVDADPVAYPVIGWGVAPGDVVAFHGLTLHGAAGNETTGERRRVLSLRWTGDDARFAPRGGPMSPPPPVDRPLVPGGPLDGPDFPVVIDEDPATGNTPIEKA